MGRGDGGRKNRRESLGETKRELGWNEERVSVTGREKKCERERERERKETLHQLEGE